MSNPFDDRPKGKLAEILGKIPGFSGYVKREARRQSDRLAREHVARNLEQAKRQLDVLSREFLETGNMDVLPKLDRLRGRLDFSIAKMRGAPSGTQVFFDADELRQELLETIYEHDLWTIADAEDFANFVGSQTVARQTPDELLASLNDKWQVVEAKLQRREELLTGKLD